MIQKLLRLFPYKKEFTCMDLRAINWRLFRFLGGGNGPRPSLFENGLAKEDAKGKKVGRILDSGGESGKNTIGQDA